LADNYLLHLLLRRRIHCCCRIDFGFGSIHRWLVASDERTSENRPDNLDRSFRLVLVLSSSSLPLGRLDHAES